MEAQPTYVPSQLLSGDTERLRRHSFTRWMSRDLLQAATDFCRNLGLVPIYAESSPDRLGRYLFWRMPLEGRCEVRSGRSEVEFLAFDRANVEQRRLLLSLHVNESDVHSAVWISAEHYETAVAVLASYGITPAQRRKEG